MVKQTCPVCSSEDIQFYIKDKKREYLRCKKCTTIFVPQEFHLNEDEEINRYKKHTNSENDPHYINFLKRVIKPVKEMVGTGSIGLDFGCGPGPVLKKLLNEDGLNIEEYDLFFKNEINPYSSKWDFIISTEVIEHLKEPLEVVQKLWNSINSRGYLFIMTQIYNDSIDFNSWYYKGDQTHITFFTKESFNILSKKLDAELIFYGSDIIVLKKH